MTLSGTTAQVLPRRKSMSFVFVFLVNDLHTDDKAAVILDACRVYTTVRQ